MTASKVRKPRNEVHVLPSAAMGGWIVGFRYLDRTGYAITEVIFRRKKSDAVAMGRDKAEFNEAELIVHNKDGRIAYRNSYGHDPKSRKG